MQVLWLGGRLGGRSGAKDYRGVAVVGASEALVAGKAEDGRASAEIPEAPLPRAAEGSRPRIPEVVTDFAERPLAETPEAVDPGIPNRPTS